MTRHSTLFFFLFGTFCFRVPVNLQTKLRRSLVFIILNSVIVIVVLPILDEAKVVVSSSQSSYTLRNLSPTTVYRIMIESENHAGHSQLKSKPVFIKTTKHCKVFSFEMCTENVWMHCLWIMYYRKPLLPKIKMMLKRSLLPLFCRIDDLIMEKLFPTGNEMIQSQIFANVFRGNHRDHHWNCYCVTHHPRSNCLWSHRFCMVRNSVFSIITLCHSLLHGCHRNGIYL